MTTPTLQVDEATRARLAELKGILETHSIRTGAFVLSSGATSQYYCDGKATTLSARGAALIGAIYAPLLAQLDVAAAGGLAMGADFITTAVAVASAASERPIDGFAVRSGGAKGHGTKKQIESAHRADGELLQAGRRVAVVEDTITGGGSIQQAIDAVRATGAEVVVATAILDRCAGGSDKLRAAGLPFFSLFRVVDDQGAIEVAL